MFKAWKEKVSTEFEKAKVNIQSQALNLVNNDAVGQQAGVGDASPSQINRNDSFTSNESKADSSNSHKYSEPGFSLVDLDDDSNKEPVAQEPPKKNLSSDLDSFFKTKLFSNVSSFVPQSDIESEYESESANKGIENVTKEQLMDAVYRQRAKVKKYREKWGEVIQVYRTTIEERDKLRNVLSETQDKAFRRINELKEQCNLEQEAKRHLEENLQVLIEEKEEQIKVLQTKIELINTSENKESQLINLGSDEKNELAEKIELLESLLAKCNESLKSNKEKLSVLTKENEQLLKYKETSEKLELEVEHFKKLKESTNASFSDIKQKLHDELESRNIIIKELKDQNEKKNFELKRKNNEIKLKTESIKSLNDKISQIETASENEKSNLIEELSRGKTAAINLLREECDKKIQSTNVEYESRLASIAEENGKLKELIKEQNTSNKQALLEEQRKQVEETRQQNEELKSQVDSCNSKLNETIDELNKVQEERENERKSLETVLAESEQKSNEFKSEICELNERIHELDALKQQFESTQQLLSTAETKTNQASNELERVRNELKEKDDTIHKINKEAKFVEKQLRKELHKTKQDLESKQFCASADLQEMEIKIKTLNDENYCYSNKISEMEKLLVIKDSEIVELNKLRTELANEITTLNEKIELLGHNNTVEQQKFNKECQRLDKSTEVTKKVIEVLRNQNLALDKEVKTLENVNSGLNEEKNKLYNELTILNNELTNFKNKLIDIFYNAYAESEIGDISSLDYDSFLTKISSSYSDCLEQNRILSENMARLEETVQKTNESCEEKLSSQKRKISQKLDTLNAEKMELIKEISNLRSVMSQNQEIQSLLEEKNTELEGCKEQIESLNDQIKTLRDNLDQSKQEINQKHCEIQVKCDELYQIQSVLSSKERELTQMQQQLDGSDQLSTKYNETAEELKLAKLRNNELTNELQLSTKTVNDMTKQVQESSKQNCTYLEEITKIKSNAKEILESKQKLKEKLKQTETKLNTLKQEHQTNLEKKSEQQQNINSLSQKIKTNNEENVQLEQRIAQLQSIISEKEKNEKDIQKKINELENKIASSNSDNQVQMGEFNNLKNDLRNSNERCIELEEKLKMRQVAEQDFKTEIISLEEKLKLNQNNEKDLQEELKVNDKITNSIKEQAQKYLNEIGELKIKIDEMNTKHEQTIDKLYKQLEVRESQLDESLLNSNSQHNATVQDLLKSKSEISQLTEQVEELRKANKDLESRLSTLVKSSDENSRQSIDKYEYQLQTLQSKLEEQKQEIAVKMDQFDNYENKLISEHKNRVTQMENEINEKNAALEEVHEYYQQRLKAKENEVKHLHEQLTSTDKNNYQINALQNSILQYHEENVRLKELVNVHHDRANDNNRSNSDMENCAILGVHLPQPTEYEYLRNILFEFMIGREPVTLAKVIAAVMRFSNEETDQIIRNQESLRSNHVK